jgi:hypothetical protein
MKVRFVSHKKEGKKKEESIDDLKKSSAPMGPHLGS